MCHSHKILYCVFNSIHDANKDNEVMKFKIANMVKEIVFGDKDYFENIAMFHYIESIEA